MTSKFDPCKPKIDSSAAASISAAMTSLICSHWVHKTAVVCPTPTSNSGALRVQFPDTGAWRLGMGSLLAYSLASSTPNFLVEWHDSPGKVPRKVASSPSYNFHGALIVTNWRLTLLSFIDTIPRGYTGTLPSLLNSR
jgi:hypothetical protein